LVDDILPHQPMRQWVPHCTLAPASNGQGLLFHQLILSRRQPLDIHRPDHLLPLHPYSRHWPSSYRWRTAPGTLLPVSSSKPRSPAWMIIGSSCHALAYFAGLPQV